MALGHGFRRLFAASAISNLGDGVRAVALPLVAAALTRDPSAVAAVGLAQRLPWMLFALVGGAVVDRVDRRDLMVRMQVFRALVVGGLAAAVAAAWASIPLLCAIAFALGMAEVAFDSAAQTILPSIVPRDRLETANGRLYGAEIVANQFAGAPLGGLLFALPPAAPFWFDAASFGLGAGLLRSIRGSFRPPVRPARTSLREDIAEGLRWLWGHRLIRVLAAMVGISNLTFTAVDVIFVLFALERLGVAEAAFGLLLLPTGIASLVATATTGWVAGRLGDATTLRISMVVLALALIAMAYSTNAWLVAALFGVCGYLFTAWNIITVSLRQSVVPDHLLGRVNSVYRLLAWGTMPLGAALGGALAEAFGLASPFLLGGGALLVAGLLAAPVITGETIAAARASAQPGPSGPSGGRV